MNCYTALQGLFATDSSLGDDGNIRLVAFYDNEEVHICYSLLVLRLLDMVLLRLQVARQGARAPPPSKFYCDPIEMYMLIVKFFLRHTSDLHFVGRIG